MCDKTHHVDSLWSYIMRQNKLDVIMKPRGLWCNQVITMQKRPVNTWCDRNRRANHKRFTSANRKPCLILRWRSYSRRAGLFFYRTDVQIVSSAKSGDSVLSESTGLFKLVLCISLWNLFWQKNQLIRLCLSTYVRPARKSFSLSTWWLQQAFWRPNWSIIQNMTYFFKWYQSGPNNEFSSLQCL